jgi:hypothetical protein
MINYAKIGKNNSTAKYNFIFHPHIPVFVQRILQFKGGAGGLRRLRGGGEGLREEQRKAKKGII